MSTYLLTYLSALKNSLERVRVLTFLDELNFDSELVIEKREKLHLLEKNISDSQGYWNPATLIGSECFYHGANLAPQLLKLRFVMRD